MVLEDERCRLSLYRSHYGRGLATRPQNLSSLYSIRPLIAQRRDVIVSVEEKFERRLVEEISKLRSELMEYIAAHHSELKTDMANLRTKMANFRADVIRWMFIFWIGQFGAIMGLFFAFFRRQGSGWRRCEI